MSIYYPAGCDALPVHTCNDCGVPLNGEMGRIRSMAIIQKDYALDPTSLSSWTTGITSGDIIIIPETTGSFDGGKAKKGPGYGDTVETYLGSDFSLKFTDPDYFSNVSFYNTLRGAANYKIAFRTQTYTHVVGVPCSFEVSAPVKEGLDTTVVWEVDVKWIDNKSPIPYTTVDGVFTCFVQS